MFVLKLPSQRARRKGKQWHMYCIIYIYIQCASASPPPCLWQDSKKPSISQQSNKSTNLASWILAGWILVGCGAQIEGRVYQKIDHRIDQSSKQLQNTCGLSVCNFDVSRHSNFEAKFMKTRVQTDQNTSQKFARNDGLKDCYVYAYVHIHIYI